MSSWLLGIRLGVCADEFCRYLAHTIPTGLRTPPISQLTVLLLPLITKRALFVKVTIYCPKSPAKKEERTYCVNKMCIIFFPSTCHTLLVVTLKTFLHLSQTRWILNRWQKDRVEVYIKVFLRCLDSCHLCRVYKKKVE